jgi:MscS family membrane protein
MDFAATKAWLDETLTNPWYRQALIVGLAILAVILLWGVVFPILGRLAQRTRSTLDDRILGRLKPTVFTSVVLLVLEFSLSDLLALLVTDPTRQQFVLRGVVGTLLVLIWGRAILDMGAMLFEKLSRRTDTVKWIQPQTLPLIKFVFKVIVISAQAYLILATWNVNLTSWLASAGVVGIAVGFAAKDTLANFISGIFILVDSPYEVGQYIVIDGVTRGEVTDIGMRSTRILTRDNVEVTVPNAVIGNAKIINESSGPSPLMRVRVKCSVAYGSDVDQVREILLKCCEGVPHVTLERAPTVRLINLGDSGVEFEVRAFTDEPEFRGMVIDTLNTRIYQRLQEAGVQIPFPQQDIRIKEWPGMAGE